MSRSHLMCVADPFKTYLQKRSDCLPNWALDEMSNLNDTAKKASARR